MSPSSEPRPELAFAREGALIVHGVAITSALVSFLCLLLHGGLVVPLALLLPCLVGAATGGRYWRVAWAVVCVLHALALPVFALSTDFTAFSLARVVLPAAGFFIATGMAVVWLPQARAFFSLSVDDRERVLVPIRVDVGACWSRFSQRWRQRQRAGTFGTPAAPFPSGGLSADCSQAID